MVRRVTARVDVDASGARKGAQDTEQSAGRIAGAFDGLKAKAGGIKDAVGGLGEKVSGLAREHLGPFGDAADKLGVDLDKVSGALPVVGAAVAGATALVASGVAKWQALTAEVKAYTSAAGLGAEEASRFNAVFKGFGVAAEDGVDVLKTMGEVIGTDAAKFDTYGVAIARAKDGSVDMAATLGNVADRFQAMRDPTERAAMGSELFGDAWVKIAPVLERGGKGLDELLAGVKGSALVTEDGIRQAEEYNRAMAELGQEFEALQIAAAKQAIPALVDGMKDLAGALETLNGFEEKFGAITAGLDAMALAFNPLKAGWDTFRDGEESFASFFATVDGGRPKLENLTGAALSAARSQQDQAAAAELAADKQATANREAAEAAQRQKDLEQALDAATAAYERAQGAVITAFEAEVAYEEQTAATQEAVGRLSEASQLATEKTNELGAESDEARAAQADYGAAVQDAKGKVLDQAAAAVDLAAKQAEVAGQSLSAAEGNRIYAEKLAEASAATNDPVLREALDALIAKYSGVAGTAWDAAAAMRDAAVAAGELNTTSSGMLVGSADTMDARTARAAGGPVLAGQSYVVGERGPELFTPGATGFVTPPDRFDRQTGPGLPLQVNVVLDGHTMGQAFLPYLELDRRSRQ